MLNPKPVFLSVTCPEKRFCIACVHALVGKLAEWEKYECLHPKNLIGYNAISGAHITNLSANDFRHQICRVDGDLWKSKQAALAKAVQTPTSSPSLTIRGLSRTTADDL